MTEPKITVLVLGFNHKKSIKKTLETALSQSYKNFEVIYIDNASKDGSVNFVREHFPKLHIIENTKNLGYAGGYNAVICEYFAEKNNFDGAVLLNPDTIASETWLEELVRSAFSDVAIGFAQSKIYLWKDGETKIFNTCGNHIHFLGFGFCGCYKKEDDGSMVEDCEIPYASGASLLIKKTAFEKVGGLDYDFFAYLEDQDIGWRGRLYGFKSILSSHAVLWHQYDFEKKHLSKLKFFLLERNRLFFLLKNVSTKTLFLIFPAFLFMEIGMVGHSIANGYVKEKLRSYKEVWQSRKRLLDKRQEVQICRTVSDRELVRFLSDTITFEDIQSLPLSIANSILRVYFWCIKRFI